MPQNAPSTGKTGAKFLDTQAIIVGAGFSGIGAGIKLKEAGIPFVVLEKAGDLGGTWRDNTYPGIAVDITSFTYSYSFEQRPDWSRVFAPGKEVQAYAHHCADKYGVKPNMRFHQSVARADFDDNDHTWTVTLESGKTITGRWLIVATGGLTQPKMPDIKGLDTFKGKVIHTARWDHSYDLKGKRVAVIGTGATSVQLVPTIADSVKHIDVFQRTPIWIMPKPDAEVPDFVKGVFEYVPGVQTAVRGITSSLTEAVMALGVIYNKQAPFITKQLERISLNHLKNQTGGDKDLMQKLTPHYGFGCKRPSFSNEFWKSFTRPDVNLITDPIQEITETGITTKDGRHYECDVLITATGFKVFEFGNTPTFPIYGLEGLELCRYFDEQRYQAYEGISIPQFPNMFMMLGPYAAIASSWFMMVEIQTVHLMRVIKQAGRKKATKVAVKRSAHESYFEDIQRRQENTVFFNNNCQTANSYYFDRHGDAPFARPYTYAEAWLHSRWFPLSDYEYTRSLQPAAVDGGVNGAAVLA